MFHVNPALAEDSHDISSIIFSEKQWQHSEVIDALRVKDINALKVIEEPSQS